MIEMRSISNLYCWHKMITVVKLLDFLESKNNIDCECLPFIFGQCSKRVNILCLKELLSMIVLTFITDQFSIRIRFQGVHSVQQLHTFPFCLLIKIVLKSLLSNHHQTKFFCQLDKSGEMDQELGTVDNFLKMKCIFCSKQG